MRTAQLPALGPEDETAIESLSDIARLLGTSDEVVVVGGHMVALLSAAYPSPGFVERRTGDSDAGITVELAASGKVHAALTAAGYIADSGNRYTKAGCPDPKPTIDLLTPSLNGRFHTEVHGGRAFDATPGLAVALHSAVPIRVAATNRSGSEITDFVVRVPTVEAALLLKAHSWAGRLAQKDVVDINNLLCIVDHHRDEIGPWNLGRHDLTGSRRDAAAHLHRLAEFAEANRLPASRIDPRRLTVLIRRHVGRPA